MIFLSIVHARKYQYYLFLFHSFSFYISFDFSYPCLFTARTLIHCGANVNARDAIRNTPLHVLVSNEKIDNEELVKFLCNNGAHLDCVNALRETPLDLTVDFNIRQWLKSKMTLSLRCLCAQMIQKQNIAFEQKLSKSLRKFIYEH